MFFETSRTDYPTPYLLTNPIQDEIMNPTMLEVWGFGHIHRWIMNCVAMQHLGQIMLAY
jgi:hypothetical protein